MYFIQEYSGFFIDQLGNLNAEGLKLALDTEGIPLRDRKDLILGIQTYITEMRNTLNESIRWNKIKR